MSSSEEDMVCEEIEVVIKSEDVELVDLLNSFDLSETVVASFLGKHEYNLYALI